MLSHLKRIVYHPLKRKSSLYYDSKDISLYRPYDAIMNKQQQSSNKQQSNKNITQSNTGTDHTQNLPQENNSDTNSQEAKPGHSNVIIIEDKKWTRNEKMAAFAIFINIALVQVNQVQDTIVYIEKSKLNSFLKDPYNTVGFNPSVKQWGFM